MFYSPEYGTTISTCHRLWLEMSQQKLMNHGVEDQKNSLFPSVFQQAPRTDSLYGLCHITPSKQQSIHTHHYKVGAGAISENSVNGDIRTLHFQYSPI